MRNRGASAKQRCVTNLGRAGRAYVGLARFVGSGKRLCQILTRFLFGGTVTVGGDVPARSRIIEPRFPALIFSFAVIDDSQVHKLLLRRKLELHFLDREWLSRLETRTDKGAATEIGLADGEHDLCVVAAFVGLAVTGGFDDQSGGLIAGGGFDAWIT